jgi:hypothetical protein
MLNTLSPGEEYEYYVLFDVLAVYNNTGFSFPTYGVIYTDPVPITLRFKKDTDVPEALDSHNINYITTSLSDSSIGRITRNFDDVINDYDLYIIKATAPEHTWYNLKITMNNGFRDANTYVLRNYDGLRDYRIRRHSIWNRFYCLDTYSNTEYVTYDDSNSSNVIFEVEFGIVDPNLIVMFAVQHVGLNGSITFEFIPHKSTVVSPVDEGRFKGGGLRLAGSIVLGILGFGALIAGIVVLVIKVIIPRRKTPV